MKKLLCALAVLAASQFSQAEIKPIGGINVKPADAITIKVKPNSVLREQFPETFFGFNINFKSFQDQLWDGTQHQVYPKVLRDLSQFKPAVYRYPGGLVGNSFSWDDAIGALSSRRLQDTIFKSPPKKAYFGVDEYLRFLDEVGGEFLYVLNIVNTNPLKPLDEAPIEDVAAKNKALAEYLVKKMGSQPRYYQLGNELDRSKYEWAPEKYAARAKAVADAIRSVDKDAHFIAFMRDFTWTYKKDKSRGVSSPDSYLKSAMNDLPGIDIYSVHHYYNGKREDHRSRAISFWMRHLEQSIKSYQQLRGNDPEVWITEHARQMSSAKPTKDLTVQYTSNLGGALATADYLITLAQVPQVKSTVWHALNAGPWQMFDATVKHKDLRPRPIYYGFRTLQQMDLPMVLDTRTASTNVSGNQNGYDVRAVGFTDANMQTLGLWAVNHSSQPQTVTVQFNPLKSQAVNIDRWFISGPKGISPDDLSLELSEGMQTSSGKGSFAADGTITLELPPTSVSTIKINPS
ncbi:hypothetical protein [Halioxenophilus aromaticivorans]|uniref:Alpha-L-arabinofuranosidase 1 catalytic domain-containing protein n=1 Tax=Halioxenophilus aromaticivorans TaxID=1306992 RepID=A0AAV3U1K7_9ALTE